jgi:pimeloyl-ACP methyl ester carboxylesterase/DNA-binding CsgD family transcriptional regulator
LAGCTYSRRVFLWRDLEWGAHDRWVDRPARQELRFVRAADGTRIAYARRGSGPVLVRAAHWLSHLEYDWLSPIWRDFLAELGEGRTLVRYDERGTGLSDRDVGDLSFEAMVGDLEALVDALDLRRFALLGMSQGGAISLAYAVRHPERVNALVLCGAYARGHDHPDRPNAQRVEADLLLRLIEVGWGTPDPKFRRVFANMFLPDASPSQLTAFDALQRQSATPDVALRLRAMFGGIDVLDLCPRVAVPTLVMHVRGDGVVPFEEGRLVAALVPGAELVALEGRGHILVPGTPGFAAFFAELRRFLGAHGQARPGPMGPAPGDPADSIAVLSRREREVLALVAAGRTNVEIAAELSLSVRTIERHLSNSYAKLGIEGKTARAAAAARFSRWASLVASRG